MELAIFSNVTTAALDPDNNDFEKKIDKLRINKIFRNTF